VHRETRAGAGDFGFHVLPKMNFGFGREKAQAIPSGLSFLNENKVIPSKNLLKNLRIIILEIA